MDDAAKDNPRTTDAGEADAPAALTSARARNRGARRLVPVLAVALPAAALAYVTLGRSLERVGHPGATLDDAYIHFQYARAIAEGHPLRFQAGQPISTGATSFLWPLALAVPWLVGFRGDAILWPAWFLAYAALAGLAYEAYRLARPLTGHGAALGAAAMVLAFGGFAWGAPSGMEIVPFAWLLARATRGAAEWAEGGAELDTPRARRALLLLAFAAPLMRPEGALGSLVAGAGAALHLYRHRDRGVGRRALWLLMFPVAAVFPNLLLLLLTGAATSSTTQVKLLAGNPYFDVARATLANARLLVSSILDGDVWSAEFLPKGGAPVAFAGLAALVARGYRTGRSFRAGAVLVLALTMFVPCTYVTFLWNRLRYLWPFATGWFVGLACLARVGGDLVGRVDVRTRSTITTLTAGAFAGVLFSKLDWVLDDVAQSASGIARQQVALGRWVAQNLPEDARVGLNDTGAIAYFGDRVTFDVVGLTTPSEGRYWVAGAGSRLEHYERMSRESPQLLPTHFIVYPEWMACPPVLGRVLHEAIVTDSTILGGASMRVFEARTDRLGSGEQPWTEVGAVHDALDVADLESERAHDYDLAGARDGEQVAQEGNAPDGSVVVDGGRTKRTREAFTMAGASKLLVGRVAADGPLELQLVRDGLPVARTTVAAGPWEEVRFELPAPPAGPSARYEVRAEGATFSSFHWWLADAAL